MTTVIKTIPVQLDLNQRYVIRVRTINSFGVSSEWSEGLFVQIGDSVETLPAPSGFNVIPAINSLIINWDLDTDGDISKYEIHAVPGRGNFYPSASTLVGVVTQSNSFIFTSIKVNNEWTQLAEGDVYTIRVRRINSAGDSSAFTSAKQGTVGAIDDSSFLQHTDIISAEEGVLSRIFVLSSEPTTAVPGDIWIQSNVVIPATPTGAGPLPPENFIVIDDTTSGPTTARLSWESTWISYNSIEKVFVYRAVGSNANALNAISKSNSTLLDGYLIDTITSPVNDYYIDEYCIDSTPVSYRIAGSSILSSTRPNGELSDLARAPDDMRNGKPRDITSLVSRASLDSVIITFNAPTQWYDPGLPNYSYSLVNTITGATVSGTFYDSSSAPSYSIGSLQANTQYSMSLVAVDKSGKLSSPNGITFQTSQANPNQPLTLTADTITASSAVLTWTVSASDALVNDRYELVRTSPSSATIATNITGGTTISYTVTGLSAGTSYTFAVRAVDKQGLVSTYKNVTFSTVADSDPPPLPVINWFKPYYSGTSPTTADYGKMYIDITWYPDAVSTTTYVVERKVDSGAWEIAYESTTAQQTILINATAYTAGQTIQVRVWSKDALNNSNQANAPTASYTLVASPTLITATFTSNYMPKWSWNNAYSDLDLKSAPGQGYYSTQDSTYNMTGIWGYASSTSGVSKFQDQLSNKTIVSATIYLRTSAAGGSSYRAASIIMHKNITKPATTAAAPVRSYVSRIDSVLPLTVAKEITVPVDFINSLKSGEWKGIGVYLESGQTSNVAHFYNISGTTTHVDSKSGRVTVYHLG